MKILISDIMALNINEREELNSQSLTMAMMYSFPIGQPSHSLAVM